jgi:hypothetical protein
MRAITPRSGSRRGRTRERSAGRGSRTGLAATRRVDGCTELFVAALAALAAVRPGVVTTGAAGTVVMVVLSGWSAISRSRAATCCVTRPGADAVGVRSVDAAPPTTMSEAPASRQAAIGPALALG